jgi:hypothetical protein
MALNTDDLSINSGIPSADVADTETYIPPRSSAFRTSKYPGFFSPGAGPNNDPNPVSGDNAVAAPSVGENGYVAPAAPAESQSLFRTVQPTSTDPNDGAEQRQADALDNARSTGYDTDPEDALKAFNIASSISPTGMIGLGVQTGLNKLGVFDPLKNTPLGDAFGIGEDGGTFDFKSNDSQRPGYSDAWKKAQEQVLGEYPKYTSPGQLTQQMHERTRDILDKQDQASRNDTLSKAQASPTGFRGTLGANAGISPAAPAAGVEDVTAGNSRTGFQQPTSPANRQDTTPTAGRPGGSTDDTSGGVSGAAPATSGAGSYNGQGRGWSGGGGTGGGGNSGNGGSGGGGYAGGGSGDNHTGMGDRGYADGGTITNNGPGGAAAQGMHDARDPLFRGHLDR